MFYSTKPEAVQAEVIAPIEASGMVADARAEFDVDAIADRVIAFEDGVDAGGVTHLNRQGFYCTVEPGEFWQVVAAHAFEVAL